MLQIYNAILIAAIGISVYLIVPFTVDLEAAIICFAIIIIFAAVIGFLFVPKLYRLHILDDKSLYLIADLNLHQVTGANSTAHTLTPYKASVASTSVVIHSSTDAKASSKSNSDALKSEQLSEQPKKGNKKEKQKAEKSESEASSSAEGSDKSSASSSASSDEADRV